MVGKREPFLKIHRTIVKTRPITVRLEKEGPRGYSLGKFPGFRLVTGAVPK